MKSSKSSRVARVGGWAWVIFAVTVAATPHDSNAQDSPPAIPLINDLGALDQDLDDPLPTLEDFTACETESCVTCPPPCCPVQVWANALFLTRSTSSGESLVFHPPKGRDVFWADDLDFGFDWGPSIGITFCPDPCNPGNRIGVEFYAIDGWSAAGHVAGNISVQFPSLPYLPELIVPGDPNSGYGSASFRYTSNLYNMEFNFYHQSANVRWLTTLAGFRWIEIGEDFSTVFATGETTPNYTIDVNNHLYGFQVGALAHLRDYGPWRVDGWLKMGVYGSAADQSTTEDFTSAGGSVVSVSAYDSNLAFASDVGISVTRQITDQWSFRFSYMGLWIDGIALAPEQLDNSDPSNAFASLDNTGNIFYHGGFVGCEYLW